MKPMPRQEALRLLRLAGRWIRNAPRLPQGAAHSLPCFQPFRLRPPSSLKISQ